MKRLFWLLTGVLLLLCACSAPVAEERGQGEQEGQTSETPGETPPVQTVSRLSVSQEPITRVDLSLYDYVPGVAGDGSGFSLCEFAFSVEDHDLKELPVFKNLEAMGLYKSPDEWSEAEEIKVEEQLERFLSCFPKSVDIEKDVLWDGETKLFSMGKTARVDAVNVLVRPGKILLRGLLPSCDWETLNTAAVKALLTEDATLKAACEFLKITAPQVFLQKTYSTYGELQDIDIIVAQTKETLEENILASNFGCIYINGSLFEDGIKTFTWIGTEDLSEVAATAPILSYADAVENLLDDNVFRYEVRTAGLPSLKKESIVGCRMTYRNDLISEQRYYIPCYEFVVKCESYTEEAPATVNLVVPACNVRVTTEPAG